MRDKGEMAREGNSYRELISVLFSVSRVSFDKKMKTKLVDFKNTIEIVYLIISSCILHHFPVDCIFLYENNRRLSNVTTETDEIREKSFMKRTDISKRSILINNQLIIAFLGSLIFSFFIFFYYFLSAFLFYLDDTSHIHNVLTMYSRW